VHYNANQAQFMNKAIFIDKDGTLIPDIPYNINPALITLQPGVEDGLLQLKNQGFLLILISNQAGIAHGYFKEAAMIQVQNKITQLLKPHRINLNGFYYCPHHPDGNIKDYRVNCFCRKPQPGLLLRAARDSNIDLKKSWMIGDILNDVEAGKRAGCKTVLIKNGNETEWLMNDYRMPDFEAANFKEAADFIPGGGVQINIHRNNENRMATM
jgi:D-glycero-D-manno-heptose 1,7-bisphosphate phosphatase